MRSSRWVSWIAMLLLLSTASAGPSRAALDELGHQGVLSLPGAGVLPPGPYVLSFSIHDTAVAGSTALFEQQHTVSVERGMYNVTLMGDGTTPLVDHLGPGPRFLEVAIVSSPGGQFDGVVVSARQQIASVPFAFHAERSAADVAGSESVPVGTILLWDDATGCDGIPATCPCGYGEAGAFRGRTVRGADVAGSFADLSDEPGLSVGDPAGHGRFGDALRAEETPTHAHTLATGGAHGHPAGPSDRYYLGTPAAGFRHEAHDDHRIASSGNTTTEVNAEEHIHLVDAPEGDPHYHPHRSVLFCRKE